MAVCLLLAVMMNRGYYWDYDGIGNEYLFFGGR
jgi:hypothetical protein